MCLYPSVVLNPKYKANKKNEGVIPYLWDERLRYVPVGCKECIECKSQKGNEWRVRLLEEFRSHQDCSLVTLTFSNESIMELSRAVLEKSDKPLSGYNLDNAIVTIAVRRFLERWRKEFGVSVKHWFSTEIGGQNYEGIHIHGFIWSSNQDMIKEKWQYGHVWFGSYVGESAVLYTTKYVMKTDFKHKGYNAKILTSSGMGSNYLLRPDSKLNAYNNIEGMTREYYVTRSGIKIALPIYYRNKIWSDEEREYLWLEKLEQQVRWVLGSKIDISKGFDNYNSALKEAQHKNSRLGFGTGEKDWEKWQYENDLRNLNIKARIEAASLAVAA